MSITVRVPFQHARLFLQREAEEQPYLLPVRRRRHRSHKRSRRLDLISRILTEYGFGVKIKGDLLIARLAGSTGTRWNRCWNRSAA